MEKKGIKTLHSVITVLVYTIIVSGAAGGRISDALWWYAVVTFLLCMETFAQLANDLDAGRLPAAKLLRLAAVSALSILEYASWAATGLFIAWSSKFVRSPLSDLGLHLLTLLCFAAGMACSWAILLGRDDAQLNDDPEQALRYALYLLPPALLFLLVVHGYLHFRPLPRTAS